MMEILSSGPRKSSRKCRDRLTFSSLWESPIEPEVSMTQTRWTGVRASESGVLSWMQAQSEWAVSVKAWKFILLGWIDIEQSSVWRGSLRYLSGNQNYQFFCQVRLNLGFIFLVIRKDASRRDYNDPDWFYFINLDIYI